MSKFLVTRILQDQPYSAVKKFSLDGGTEDIDMTTVTQHFLPAGFKIVSSSSLLTYDRLYHRP